MMAFVENINVDGAVAAIIIKADYSSEGIEFFTPREFSQQLGYMKRPKGHIIDPHVHLEVERLVVMTSEVLLLKSGRVRVDFYNHDELLVDSRILEKGDLLLLATGGHGFEMLEDSELLEIKQGPYNPDHDKRRFSKTESI